MPNPQCHEEMKTINACSEDSKDVIVITIETCDKKGKQGEDAEATSSNPVVSKSKNAKICGENPDNVCPRGGRCVKCTKRKRNKKGGGESVGDTLKVQKIQLPILNPRLHGPGCAMEVCVLERHEPNCLYKKLENDQRHPSDDRSGSYDCIGRMAFRTCNPEEGLVMEQNRPQQPSNQNNDRVAENPAIFDSGSIRTKPTDEDFADTKSERRNTLDDLYREMEYQNSPRPSVNNKTDDYDRRSFSKQPSPQDSFRDDLRSQKSKAPSQHDSYREPAGQRSPSKGPSPQGSLRGEEGPRSVRSPRGSIREEDEPRAPSRQGSIKDEPQDQGSYKGSVGGGSRRNDNNQDSQLYESAVEDGHPTKNESYTSAPDRTRNGSDGKNATVMTLLTQPIYYETFRKEDDSGKERKTHQHDLLTFSPPCCSRNGNTHDEIIKNLVKSTKVFENVAIHSKINKKVKCDKGNQIPACTTKGVDVPSLAHLNNDNENNAMRNSDETIISLTSYQNTTDDDESGKFRLFGFLRNKKTKSLEKNIESSIEPQAVSETMKRIRK